MEKERRKKIIQEGKSPRKYISMLIVSFVVVLFVVELHFYWFMRSILKTMEFSPQSSGVIGLGIIIMVILFILIAIIGLINIIFTQRFFGPINRLTKELSVMEKTGDYHPLEVRKNDELYNITIEVNKLMEKIK